VHDGRHPFFSAEAAAGRWLYGVNADLFLCPLLQAKQNGRQVGRSHPRAEESRRGPDSRHAEQPRGHARAPGLGASPQCHRGQLGPGLPRLGDVPGEQAPEPGECGSVAAAGGDAPTSRGPRASRGTLPLG